MGRNRKITSEQAQIFVDELTDILSDYDMGLPKIFTLGNSEAPRIPSNWPQFFRAVADALEREQKKG